MSLGLLTSSAERLRSLPLLLDKTRSSCALIDLDNLPLLIDLTLPLVDLVCLEGLGLGCLIEELLLMLDCNSDSNSEY